MKKLNIYLRFARKNLPKVYFAYRVVRWVVEFLSETINYRAKCFTTTNTVLN